MKSSNATLINFMRNTQNAVRADLFTITLNGGSQLFWSSADVPVTYGGQTYGIGPICSDSGIASKAGVEASTTDITFAASPGFTIGGVPFIDWVQAGGFSGATISIDRVVAPDWPTLVAGGTGGYLRFLGRFDGIKDLGLTEVVVTASDWRVLLANKYPQDSYQTSCRFVFGGPECQFNVSSLTVTGIAVTAVTSPGVFAAASSLGAHAFTLGTIEFTSGANAGISRTIKAYDGAGNFTTTAPFPAAPGVGDQFTATPGCNLTTTQCAVFRPTTWQDYFGGQPYIPAPTTGLPT